MLEDLDEVTLKVIVVGNGRVGKTSMTTRYCSGVFTGTYKKTIGVDFMEKRIMVLPNGDAREPTDDDELGADDGAEAVTLMIWDTAGQEEFDQLTSRYYKGAGAVVYAFSTVDRDSFEAVPRWREKVREECGDIASVLVQNKMDRVEDSVVDRDEAFDLADAMGVRLFRASVADDYNIAAIFEHLTAEFLRGDRAESGAAVPAVEALASALAGGSPAGAAVSSPAPSPAPAAASRAPEDDGLLRSRVRPHSDPNVFEQKQPSKRRTMEGGDAGCSVS